MKERLNCVMLIDDDEDDNFFHRIVLEETGLTENIQIAESAEEALQLLSQQHINPELIFLDLNMPRINGLEFLDELNKIQMAVNPVIVLLTTSVYPFDKENNLQERISRIEIKPLTAEKLSLIASTYFNIAL